jgi:hypothetical protein
MFVCRDFVGEGSYRKEQARRAFNVALPGKALYHPIKQYFRHTILLVWVLRFAVQREPSLG